MCVPQNIITSYKHTQFFFINVTLFSCKFFCIHTQIRVKFAKIFDYHYYITLYIYMYRKLCLIVRSCVFTIYTNIYIIKINAILLNDFIFDKYLMSFFFNNMSHPYTHLCVLSILRKLCNKVTKCCRYQICVVYYWFVSFFWHWNIIIIFLYMYNV